MAKTKETKNRNWPSTAKKKLSELKKLERKWITE